MESNREEALRCVDLARSKLARGDLDGALKFTRKSLQLFSTPEAEKLQLEINSQFDNQSNQEAMKSKVAQILKIDARDYYSILNVDKSSTQAGIKKSYRKVTIGN